MKYSFIIPVFNRPDEVDELLESLCTQTVKDFEVVIVEDGSDIPCKDVADKYATQLDIRYFTKENSGPGETRNFGAEHARGEYLLILDSDAVLPPGYLGAIEKELADRPCDAFGGPDKAHESFTPMQKAINYAMTAFLTTGGIRGGKRKMDKFYPRSFNMGVRSDVYRKLGGFSQMRFGEDIDFSTRIFKAGCSCSLFPEAWMWHKRRTNLRRFFKQVHNSGIARINLTKRHPGTLKLVHLLPSVFTVCTALLLATALAGLVWHIMGGIRFSLATAATHIDTPPHGMTLGGTLLAVGLGPLLAYSLLILLDSTRQNKSLLVGVLSVPAAFVQLTGYGSGFLRSWWRRCVLKKGEFEAFKKNFYK